jgi:hypothetical protein
MWNADPSSGFVVMEEEWEWCGSLCRSVVGVVEER